MQAGYYNAAAGMVAQFNRLDTIANNLANVNTAGYKEDGLVTGDFMRLYKEARDELPNENNSKEGAKFLNRTLSRAPQIVDSYTNQNVGIMQKTDNTFDFALSQEGLFFAVKTPNGIRLTRDGSFTTSNDGKLVTKQGFEVLGSDGKPIEIGQNDNIIHVDKNGKLSVNTPGTLNFVERQTFYIAAPDNLSKLQKEGSNLYKFDEGDALKPQAQTGSVQQGFIEKSNVNAVNMMVKMIETNRLVGMYQKVMDTQMNDLNQDAINKLASTKA
ncbi:flagellar hook-basal body protein [Sulfurimonas sp. HSL3-2]|uniref:flagellar hook-basal body protein n=1 Tax=Hydrocurvibacter mobilis TaxID=3131936 RepID=UPI0031F8DCBC